MTSHFSLFDMTIRFCLLDKYFICVFSPSPRTNQRRCLGIFLIIDGFPLFSLCNFNLCFNNNNFNLSSICHCQCKYFSETVCIASVSVSWWLLLKSIFWVSNKRQVKLELPGYSSLQGSMSTKRRQEMFENKFTDLENPPFVSER